MDEVREGSEAKTLRGSGMLGAQSRGLNRGVNAGVSMGVDGVDCGGEGPDRWVRGPPVSEV